MNTKSLIQLFILIAVLLASFASTSSAFAAACGTSVTVVSGDTLRKIADRCDTTVSALRLANPEIGSGQPDLPGTGPASAWCDSGHGWWLLDLYRGPRRYVERSGGSLWVHRGIASVASNPDITNANVIYEGQRLTIYSGPGDASANTPPPASGQTYYAVKR